MGILVKNSSFELLRGEPQPSIAFDNSTYSLAGEEDTTLSAQFSVLDNNNEDVTDKCIITFNNEYVTVEDGAFVCEGLEVGTYTTVVTAVYTYKSATVTANATINLTIESAQHDYSQDYLTFEALESGTFKSSNGVDYSLDNGTTWTTLAVNTASPTVAQGDKIMWRGQVNWNGRSFTSTGRFNAYGNVMSLMYGDNYIGQTTFPSGYVFQSGLFKGNNKLVSAENLILPVTTLITNCYFSMFYGCTSLTTAPELPATTLAAYCYDSMFQNCTSLTTAPELPATTLAAYCYDSMFQNCTSLTTAPSTLPATTMTQYCYENMFFGCTSLTTAPELPATTLAISCYNIMFTGCTNLNYIKAMFTTRPGEYNGTQFWVKGVAASGTFVKNSAATWNETGAHGIPSGWTVQTASE